MPIVMQKVYAITGNYTTEQKAILQNFIDIFRIRMADDYPEKNILNGKVNQYSDNDIIRLLQVALNDLNGGYPRTCYTLFNLSNAVFDDDLVITGAIIFALIKEGILQLRNQIDFNDSGLSIAMFNKTGAYQGWLGFLLQQYLQDKAEAKRSILPKSNNAGFVGVGSEFGYRLWTTW